MSSLFINDLDAGAGRMGSATQYTVNNQMVNATLMNIADNPTNVQLPGVYKVKFPSRYNFHGEYCEPKAFVFARRFSGLESFIYWLALPTFAF